ncbi:MAG TPA: DUF1285 domain-containing protein [Acidimicrobiales bacterium]
MPADQSPAQTENCPSAPGAPGAPGAYDIRIARDGTWFHEGAPIGRKPLVKLFASVLWRDDGGGYWLRTPAERGRIEVEDAPFTAVELSVTGEGVSQILAFRTNLDDWVEADAAHPLRVAGDPAGGDISPYILVRDRLEALILRPVYYELAELAVAAADDGAAATERLGHCLGVWSNGVFFPLGNAPVMGAG